MKSDQCTDIITPKWWQPPSRPCGIPYPHEGRSRLVYYEQLPAFEPVLTVDITGLCGPCVEETMREKWPGNASVCEHWMDHKDGTKEIISRDTASICAVDNFNPRVLAGGREF